MNVDFSKYSDGLVPAIIQDAITSKVLMLGFMNADAIEQTRQSGKVSFYSRSKQRLWTKGETSGNYLNVKSIVMDCDRDTLLILANPVGPVCHSGNDTCFNENNKRDFYPKELERIISSRLKTTSADSYTSKLVSSGIHKVAQKVGEEAIELVIEAMKHDDDLFLNEAADLLFHYTILLKARGYSTSDVSDILEKRHLKSIGK